MAKFERMQVKGAAQLVKLLNELPARVARNGLRNAVYAGAKVVRDEAKSRAPKAAEAIPNPTAAWNLEAIRDHETYPGAIEPHSSDLLCDGSAWEEISVSGKEEKSFPRCLVLALH